MKSNRSTTLTIAIAAVLVIFAGGAIVAGAAFVGASDEVSTTNGTESTSENGTAPDDYELDVVDPDDRLSDDDVDRAIALGWTNESVREHVETNASFEITVQATGSIEEVGVVFDDGEAAVSATIDLTTESVTRVLSPEQVMTADDLETVDVDVNDSATVDANETFTFEVNETLAEPDGDNSTDVLADTEIEIVELEPDAIDTVEDDNEDESDSGVEEGTEDEDGS